MSSTSFKHQLFSQFARVAKALGNGSRLELLEFLAQGERSVDVLAKLAGLSVANTSQHLQHLRRAGLVVGRKDGLRVIYRLTDPAVVELLSVLRTLAEKNLAEVGKLVFTHLSAKDQLEPVSAAQLLQRLRAGAVTALDVRPPEEFAAGHLPGAVNIPIDKLESGLSKLSRQREVVAYCRGPYCLMSFEAVLKLRKRGWKARRLRDGFPEWKAAGLPVD